LPINALDIFFSNLSFFSKHIEQDSIRGQLVREFADIRGGAHSIVWDRRDNSGREVGSGVYFYRLTSPSVDTVQRMVVIK